MTEVISAWVLVISIYGNRMTPVYISNPYMDLPSCERLMEATKKWETRKVSCVMVSIAVPVREKK